MGGYSQIQCELLLMGQAIKRNYDFYHLLSGHDFLLRPVQKVQSFFEQYPNHEFLAVDYNPKNKEQIRMRIEHYHVIFHNRRITIRMNQLLSYLQNCFGVHKSICNTKYHIVKGMNWGSFSHKFVSLLLKDYSMFEKILRHSLCADEVYKQIEYDANSMEFSLYKEIPLNSKQPRSVLESYATMHFVDWCRGNPYTFRIDDFDNLINSPYMFGRKFDSRIDRQIIDQLYAFDTENF